MAYRFTVLTCHFHRQDTYYHFKLVAENLAHDNYLGAYRVFRRQKNFGLIRTCYFALMFWGGYFVEH